jgi:predicted DNA-binding transcriptional regulator AlpA
VSDWKAFLDDGARGGRYLPWKEVARATGLSRTTAWRLQKRGEFPAPYAISPGRVGYREDEVEAWRISRDHSGGRRGPRG